MPRNNAGIKDTRTGIDVTLPECPVEDPHPRGLVATHWPVQPVARGWGFAGHGEVPMPTLTSWSNSRMSSAPGGTGSVRKPIQAMTRS